MVSQWHRNNLVQAILADRHEELFDKLDLKLRVQGSVIYAPCPIHQGDNQAGFTMYLEGQVPGWWVCRTKACSDHFKHTIIGFIQGILSSQRGWNKQGDTTATFGQTMGWIKEKMGIDPSLIKASLSDADKAYFSTYISKLERARAHAEQFTPRNKIREMLSIPSVYLMGRGFTKEVLTSNDVGEANGRAVFPVYIEDGKRAAGCTARSIYEECKRCGWWHNGGVCPRKDEGYKFSKWRNSPKIEVRDFLYNFWRSAEAINKTGTCVITEGPLDCMRLMEAGFYNCVSLMGAQMTGRQKVLLETCQAQKLVLLLDMDDAGRKGCEQIVGQCHRLYNIVIPTYNSKDVGDMKVAHVQSELGRFLK